MAIEKIGLRVFLHLFPIPIKIHLLLNASSEVELEVVQANTTGARKKQEKILRAHTIDN